MTIKNKIVSIAISILISNYVAAEETSKDVSSKDLTSFKWGMSKAQFMGATQEKYEKASKDKGGDYYSKDYMMIADLPFKQIVRFQDRKGLSAINYINISDKETFEASCKNISNFIKGNFSDPSYQAIDKNSAFYVWIDLKRTTLYQLCFSEKPLQTVILTVGPQWKVINCTLEKSQNEFHFFVDEMNNDVREYAQNYISDVLKSKISTNTIEFTTKKEPTHIIINQKDMSFSAKSQDGKIEKGHCNLLTH